MWTVMAWLVLAMLSLPAAPAAAKSSVYDVQYCVRAYDGAMECAYHTLHQCLAAVWATGGDCAVNPRYSGDPLHRAQPSRRSRR